MPRRSPSVVVSAKPRSDGQLSIVLVDGPTVVLSNGVELLARYTKLQTLCEAICQERAAITVRTWIASDGEELIELHRAGEPSTASTTEPISSEGVF